MVAELPVSDIQIEPPRQSNITPGGGKPGSSAYKARECLVLQDSMKEIALNENLKPIERASAVRVWKEVDQHRRFILGLANPAPIKTDTKRQSRSNRADRLAVLDPMPAPSPAAPVDPPIPPVPSVHPSPPDAV